jgi:hypothetical protein
LNKAPEGKIPSGASLFRAIGFAAPETPLNNSGKIESLPFGTGRLA